VTPGPLDEQGVSPGVRIEARTQAARVDSGPSEKNGESVQTVYSRAKEEARAGKFPLEAI